MGNGSVGEVDQAGEAGHRWLVYKVVSRANGKIYIGYTGGLQRRMNAHRNDARRGSRYPFHAAIRKYGWERFDLCVLGWFPTEAAAKAAERHTIVAERAQNRRIGYNVADGGDGIGSGGAIAVHRRPGFRRELLASMPGRHAKAQATKRACDINRVAGAKAAETKRLRGTHKLAGIKAAATRAARLT